MIAHHPSDELLLALAAGAMRAAMALPVRVHLDGCPACRRRAADFEAIGGDLLESQAPEALAPTALAQVLRRIDAQRALPDAALPVRPARQMPSLPDGLAWPGSLRRCAISGWRWVAPGMRWATARPPEDPAQSTVLLRIAPGMSLARHTHRGIEMTQVLCGTFDDGRSQFGPGDFDMADGQILHQPVVRAGTECVCLAYVEGGLQYESRLAGLLGRWIGL